jgi:putative membrane protein
MLKHKWRDEGNDPDYRFSLANERTFLAWIRTALSLIAGGVLLKQFAINLHPTFVILALAVSLATTAALLSLMAYYRWRDNEIAMRHSLPLPFTALIPFLSGSLLVIFSTLGLIMLVF